MAQTSHWWVNWRRCIMNSKCLYEWMASQVKGSKYNIELDRAVWCPFGCLIPQKDSKHALMRDIWILKGYYYMRIMLCCCLKALKSNRVCCGMLEERAAEMGREISVTKAKVVCPTKREMLKGLKCHRLEGSWNWWRSLGTLFSKHRELCEPAERQTEVCCPLQEIEHGCWC